MSYEENKTEQGSMECEPHIIGGATWKEFDNDECPECGDCLEIETRCELINIGNDGDLVRCVTCGWIGQLTVDEDGNSYIHD